ncbi:3-deoxy-7-phosphoheptulonate synthase [Spirochaeta lutea]|nr:3-deoxy-7-phosphoheptulonate synthase [Spirochaeta lutea]
MDNHQQQLHDPMAGPIEKTSDLRIASVEALTPPSRLIEEIPITAQSVATVVESRGVIQDILTGRDRRLLGVVGPCSIHDPELGLEYARHFAELRKEVEQEIYLVMRVYFEKPRTKLGWRGLILDPHLNGSYDIQTGLRLARKLLVDITSLGIPTGSEMLDPIVPQYIDDLLSWGAIGARTTESQTHREMASGLSMPIGFKNGTDGNIETAVNAMASSCKPHRFIGIDIHGNTCVLATRGNELSHLILRGGNQGPNYYREQVERSGQLLRQAGLLDRVMVDCSHANSGKDHTRQRLVLEDILRQRLSGVHEITGFMLESNIHEGRQAIPENLDQLKHGVSITDACISLDETRQLLLSARDLLASGSTGF